MKMNQPQHRLVKRVKTQQVRAVEQHNVMLHPGKCK